MAERFRLLLFVFALTFVACSRGKERSKVSGPSAVDVPRARFVGSTARGRWEHWRVERDGGPTLDTYAVRTEGASSFSDTRNELVIFLTACIVNRAEALGR